MSDCACCGVHIMAAAGGKCDSCASGECDPAVTWHCATVECDGTACEEHTPKRRADRKPRYVDWGRWTPSPDGTTGRLRLDLDAAGTGYWVSRRFPHTKGVEWLGHLAPGEDGWYATRAFGSMYGESLGPVRRWRAPSERTVITDGARALARQVVRERFRLQQYGNRTIAGAGF